MAYLPLAAALLATVGGDLADYNDLGQAALEVTTVGGYGEINSLSTGNPDEGDYLAVVMYPMGDRWYPITVHFNMTGPQGSLGPININDPFGITGPLTMDDLATHGLWSTSARYN